MGRTPRAAAAAFIRERTPLILPRVVADAAPGDASASDTQELRRRLTAFLERRIPPWIDALEAEGERRRDLILSLLQIDQLAGEHIPPIVLLGTVAIGYRVIESEMRLTPQGYDYPADELWAEVDLLRRAVLETRREVADGGGRVA